MTFDQIALLSLLAVLMGAFAVDRWRVEVVALAGLGAAFLLGLVGSSDAVAGLSDPAVVTVVELLLLTQLIGRSELAGAVARRLSAVRLGEPATVALLCALAAVASSLMNNIGALALMLPIVSSVSRSRGISARQLLMPVSFATLLGGMATLIGTPANLVASNALAEATGTGLGFFALAPVGATLAALGILWLAAGGYRLLSPAGARALESRSYPVDLFLTEVILDNRPDLSGRSVSEIEAENGLTIYGVFRGERRLFGRKSDQRVAAGDILLLGGGVDALRTFLRRHRLQPALSEPTTAPPAERVWVEAVVMPHSMIVGSPTGSIAAFSDRGVQVVGISPHRTRVEGRLSDVASSIGDVILVRGRESDIADALDEVDCVPLAARQTLFPSPRTVLPLTAFAGGVVLASTDLLPTHIAFGAAIVVLCLAGVLDLRAELRDVSWSVIVMLAAMLPIGGALHTTGAAAVIASAALESIGEQPLVVLLGAVILAGVLITPFLNNVTTAVILSPVAISLGQQTGAPPDLMLMAVAVGASADFLTPFGHHNNTLVMGLGGYSFADFARVGAILTLIVLLVAPLVLVAVG